MHVGYNGRKRCHYMIIINWHVRMPTQTRLYFSCMEEAGLLPRNVGIISGGGFLRSRKAKNMVDKSDKASNKPETIEELVQRLQQQYRETPFVGITDEFDVEDAEGQEEDRHG